MQYRSLFPSSTITVVEIDPVVHYVANLCFGLIEDGTMITMIYEYEDGIFHTLFSLFRNPAYNLARSLVISRSTVAYDGPNNPSSFFPRSPMLLLNGIMFRPKRILSP